MQRATNHNQIISFVWNIANKLRGPYRPPQYRRVMLPMIVLRRFDLLLAENKEKVLAEKKRLEGKNITGPALEKALSRVATTRQFYVYQPLRSLETIATEISQLQKDIVAMLGEVL